MKYDGVLQMWAKYKPTFKEWMGHFFRGALTCVGFPFGFPSKPSLKNDSQIQLRSTSTLATAFPYIQSPKLVAVRHGLWN